MLLDKFLDGSWDGFLVFWMDFWVSTGRRSCCART